jgi:hypothetical protein
MIQRVAQSLWKNRVIWLGLIGWAILIKSYPFEWLFPTYAGY